MKPHQLLTISIVSISIFLGACSSQPVQQSSSEIAPSESLVGADRDENGCIGSAGYQWCASLGKCVRPWELAEEQGIENEAESVQQFCAGDGSSD